MTSLLALSAEALVASHALGQDAKNSDHYARSVNALIPLQTADLKTLDTDERRFVFWLNISGALYWVAKAKFSEVSLELSTVVCFLISLQYVTLAEIRTGILRANRPLASGGENLFKSQEAKIPFSCTTWDPLVVMAAHVPESWSQAGPWQEPLDRDRLTAAVKSALLLGAAEVRNVISAFLWDIEEGSSASWLRTEEEEVGGDGAAMVKAIMENARDDPCDLLPDVPETPADTLMGACARSLDVEGLAKLEQRLRDDLSKLEIAQAKLHAQEPHAQTTRGPALPKLRVGRGYRMLKAPHEVLVTEISSRVPPEATLVTAAPQQVRKDAERFQAALRATVGALDVSEKAGRVMQEILSSEREYFTDLGMLQRLYVKPLTDGSKTKGFFLTERDVADLFSNFDEIFKLNLDLLRNLEVESKKPQNTMDAGQLFLNFADRFQVYAQYCANANAAKKRMEAMAQSNKRFAEFCEKTRSNAAHKGLDIGSFLIKPLQRLCQYPLLLRELLAALPNQQNELYDKLKKAHKVMEDTVENVNGMLKSIRKRTEVQRLNDLLNSPEARCNIVRPSRQFSASGTFSVNLVVSGSKKESTKWHHWECWLLSDVLLLTERVHASKQSTSDRLLLKGWAPLEIVELLPEDNVQVLSPRRNVKPSKPKIAPGGGFILALPDGSRIYMASEDKKLLAIWAKKLPKKIAHIKSL